MEDFQMYSRIQQHKKQGFTRDAAARRLSISWSTVNRYWDMTIEDYEAMANRQYSSDLDQYRDTILGWLKTFRDVSSAQIQDWILEHYEERYKERTVRDYVLKLRREYDIPKHVATREYGTVPELPPGKQLQADFGEYNAIRHEARRIKLYFVIFILAHSRYKFIVWQDKPFTSIDFVRSLESCFQAIGGVPEELVIDQDRLMVVNENYGEILYTKEFERCKTRHGFEVWLCRKNDPESKGMVESGVKFVKYNFARHRLFLTLNQWSADSVEWLVRTGNGKVHTETKKIPAVVFASEKDHLKPVLLFASPEASTDRIPRTVLKNNTLRHNGSRYELPIGTYTAHKTVFVIEEEGQLRVYTPDDILIAQLNLATAPGQLVENTHFSRDTSVKIESLMSETMEALGGGQEAEAYLKRIHKVRKRYIRDQLKLILSVTGKYTAETIRKALIACHEYQSDAATDFRDLAALYDKQVTFEELAPETLYTTVEDQPHRYKMAKVSQHDPSIYQALIQKGGN